MTITHSRTFRWLETRRSINTPGGGKTGYTAERILQIGEYQPIPGIGGYELVWHDIPTEVVYSECSPPQMENKR